MTGLRVPGVKVFIAGHGRFAMPPSIAFLTSRWAAPDTVVRRTVLQSRQSQPCMLAALGLMVLERERHCGELGRFS